MRNILTAAFAFIAMTSWAQAQDYKTILDLPAGATLVNLSASEQVEIAQDLLVAVMSYQDEDKSPKAVQDTINKKMKDAVDAAKKVSSVKISTQQYYVYEYDSNQGKKGLPINKVWRGQQGVMIKGKTADELLSLVGTLQEMGLTMQGLSYQISPELLEETRESLLEAALKKLTAKAERTAKALGKSKAEMKTINIDMGGYYPQPMMRGMAMKAEMADVAMAPPVAEAGEQQITLSVSAQALLQ